MGTRADFYVGRGEQAEWLGSIAWDGHPDSVFGGAFRPGNFSTADGWREAVAGFLASRKDATLPEQGWPWPWDNSQTTDYAYAFDGDAIWGSSFGHEWFRVDPTAECFGEPEWDPTERKVDFPDMTARKAVTYGPRSGIMVISARGDAE